MPSRTVFDEARLARQIAFLGELDKLKDILRRSFVVASGGLENAAEHSWHLALMALVLLEHVQSPEIDPLRVLKMLLIHDVVEIDAGDTFCYDAAGNETKAQREQAAAARIFALLPPDQAEEIRAWWDEFEGGNTPEARLAQGLDRLQPILQNLSTGGASWRKHGVTKEQVLARNQKIGDALPEIWKMLRRQLDAAEEKGFFAA